MKSQCEILLFLPPRQMNVEFVVRQVLEARTNVKKCRPDQPPPPPTHTHKWGRVGYGEVKWGRGGLFAHGVAFDTMYLLAWELAQHGRDVAAVVVEESSDLRFHGSRDATRDAGDHVLHLLEREGGVTQRRQQLVRGGTTLGAKVKRKPDIYFRTFILFIYCNLKVGLIVQ